MSDNNGQSVHPTDAGEKVSVISKLNYIFNAREKFEIVLLLFAVVLGTFMELLGVAIFSPFMSIITDQSQIQGKWYLKYLYDLFHFTDNASFISFLAGVIICIYIVKNLYLALEKWFMYRFSYSNQMRISDRLLSAYMEEPYTFHLSRNVAVLQRTLQQDSDMFTKGVIHSLDLIAEAATCLTIGLYLFIVSKSIAVCVLVLLVICVLLFTTISRRFSKNLGKKNQIYQGKIYQWMNQALGGIKEIKILGRESFFQNSYHEYFAKFTHGLMINRMIGVLPKYVVEAVCMTGLLSAIIIKINYGQKSLLEYIPQLSVFAVAAFRLLPSVGKINEKFTFILYSLPSFDLIYQDLKDVADHRAPGRENIDASWKLKDRIVISHVNYRYPESQEDVIHDACFEIRKGETTAFIGPSGAGKTTMADVILGLLPPQYGHIFADELDVYKNVRTWQKEIGYIPQVIYLSDDTIRNNVAFGIKEKDQDEAAIIEAIKKAQLLDFVNGLPDGLDTYVGDRGVRISGGQRQRIGIARALYHDPEVLILDEATSALDTETETAVMEAIDHLHGEKTMIIIAHRLTTIRNADKVFEIQNTCVTERCREDVVPFA